MERFIVGLPRKGWDIRVGEGSDELVGGWNRYHGRCWGGARDGWKGGGIDAGFAVIVVFRELKTVEDLVIYADTN